MATKLHVYFELLMHVKHDRGFFCVEPYDVGTGSKVVLARLGMDVGHKVMITNKKDLRLRSDLFYLGCLMGLEPTTCGTTNRRSNQLS